MSFVISAPTGGAFKRVPTGVHIARCINMIDLGTQKVDFQGEIKHQRKIQIGWEVLGEDEAGVPLTVEIDGREVPMTISKRYTASMHEKAKLRADAEAWRGKPFTPEELKAFDFAKLLGAYCMLNVQEVESNGKTYSNIVSITPLPRELAKHKPASDTPFTVFDVSNPDMEVFNGFYEKLQDVIKASAEWQARGSKVMPGKAAPVEMTQALQDMDDDIPF